MDKEELMRIIRELLRAFQEPQVAGKRPGLIDQMRGTLGSSSASPLAQMIAQKNQPQLPPPQMARGVQPQIPMAPNVPPQMAPNVPPQMAPGMPPQMAQAMMGRGGASPLQAMQGGPSQMVPNRPPQMIPTSMPTQSVGGQIVPHTPGALPPMPRSKPIRKGGSLEEILKTILGPARSQEIVGVTDPYGNKLDYRD